MRQMNNLFKIPNVGLNCQMPADSEYEYEDNPPNWHILIMLEIDIANDMIQFKPFE